MEILGIGIPEVILIALIALIVLGPQDTVRAGRNLGRAVRRFFSSEEWRTMLQATKEIRTIPDKLLEETGLDHPEEILPSEEEIRKEAGLDDLERDMSQWKADLSAMSKGNATGTNENTILTPQNQPNQILPPTTAPPSSAQQEIQQDADLQDAEKDMSEWKADLSAWGSSPVIIPVPATTNERSEETTPDEAVSDDISPSKEADRANEKATASTDSPTSPKQDSQ